MNIPQFPEFKNIELSDETVISQIISRCKLPPYADFNFINIWAWNFHDKMMVSMLYDNLVVVFSDYVSDDKFISFIGKNNLAETAKVLINYSNENFNKPYLRLIPEDIAQKLKNGDFEIFDDRDSFDYIYSVEKLSDINQWPKKNNHFKSIQKFLKLQPYYTIKYESIESVDCEIYLKLFKIWSQNKCIDNCDELNEYNALKRIINIKKLKSDVISIYIDGNLIGFTIYEIISNNYAVAHFSKADTTKYPGIYDILIWEEGKLLKKMGIRYYNWEQDLGISGLRFTKNSYQPCFFLKKYNVYIK